ncbi:hypothetical protein [Phenylobacterium sp.]|uniref:hypothetical protein n=1 Tax=Phenylobacterium sp. TaxID=1871053 RepID=UPI0027306B0A|nr:hypothetical protein [Phenylobacterium sp.]MDP1986322.1 hypothetical protein [Phenylobacterium sp.]
MLETLPKAISLYEPMGLSGDRRITQRFPMPGEPDFSRLDLATFVDDLRHLRLRYHSQRRDAAVASPMRRAMIRLIGTRALATYRIAKLMPYRQTLIWKDPLAVFCIPEGADNDFRSVVTFRPPLAQAASYRRLGWLPKIREIYDRYRSVYGAVAVVEDRLDQLEFDSVGAGALLWHLIHLRLLNLSGASLETAYLFAPAVTGESEAVAYEHLFHWLGYDMPARAQALLAERQAGVGRDVPKSGKTHDWNRTAEQANSYWNKVLSEDEACLVRDVNDDLWNEVQGVIQTRRAFSAGAEVAVRG